MQNFNTQLMLLPGLDGTGTLFRPLQDELDRDCKIVGYPSDQELDLPQLAAIVLEELSQTDTASTVLLAESFSGLVALTLLAQSQIRIAGVIFVGAFAQPPHPLLTRLSALVRLSAPLVRSIPGFLVRQYCLGADASAAQLGLLRQAVGKVSPAVLAQRLRLIAAHHSFGEARFNVPCCYIRATGDRLVPASSRRWFQQHFNTLCTEEVRGPHFLLQARPRESAVAIERAVQWMTARESGEKILRS